MFPVLIGFWEKGSIGGSGIRGSWAVGEQTHAGGVWTLGPLTPAGAPALFLTLASALGLASVSVNVCPPRARPPLPPGRR